VENGVPENRPGDMPAISGNSIVIDHHNGEFSVLSHFTKGSILVGVGDEVVSGQVLGHCGNTGHSSEPHLHYHLQDTPVLHSGDGLPAQFHSYEANGKEVRRGEPSITQAVRHKNR
jgi:murein DD-endopeptidase MepM/ murein hydrolase activator NlpD